MKKLFVVLLALASGACTHIVRSEPCLDFMCATPDLSRGDVALQRYALPMTVVDFNFTKPQNGPPALAAAPRFVTDPRPEYWYRLAYDPHPAADDEMSLTVKDGLLNSAEAQSTSRVSDIISLVQPLVTSLGVTDRGEGPRVAADSMEARRRAIRAMGPDDIIEIVTYPTSTTCPIEHLAGSTGAPGGGGETPPRCMFQVGARVYTIRIECSSVTDRQVLDVAHLSRLFGTVTRTAACTGSQGNQGTFSAQYTDGQVFMDVALDRSATELDAFWRDTNDRGAMPFYVGDCTASNTECFPQGGGHSLYYRATAPFQTVATACIRAVEFPENEAPRLLATCEPIDASTLAFTGVRQRFPVVVRRAAFGLGLPRGIGADHRKYTFSNGVLEGVEIEREGVALGVIRLPLSIFGLDE